MGESLQEAAQRAVSASDALFGSPSAARHKAYVEAMESLRAALGYSSASAADDSKSRSASGSKRRGAVARMAERASAVDPL